MPKIAIATGNENKIREINELLNDLQIDLVSARELNLLGNLREDGSTFEDNALQKAREIHRASGLPALADDSGLEVFFLNHRPGVRSARYAGEQATDEENNKKLLRELGPLSHRRRTARFRCVIAFVDRETEITTMGDCRGYVLEFPKGKGGFGYDPLFRPAESDKTFAEMTDAEKHLISHRARAVLKMKPLLREYFEAV